MKYKKNILIKLFAIYLIFFAINTHNVFAVKRAIFPDSKSLQPIPTGATANISGNINSTSETLPQQNPSVTSTSVSAPSNAQEQNNTQSSNFLIAFIISIITVLIIMYFVYIYKKVKTEESKTNRS